jgi:tetraacyldisaccharide 4'-kinase
MAVPVMVGRDRVAAAQALLEEQGCDILVADDGLQHYRLQRDIEILLVDGDRRLGNGYCLPAGPLREPAERALTADFVVCRGGRAHPGEYPMTLAGGLAENLADSHAVPLADLRGRPLHAVAGIGNPEQFFDDLRAAGLEIIAHDFPDHHPFQASDLAFNDELPILMTEKDAVKCRRFAESRHWMLRVDASLPPAFGSALLQRLRTKHDG